MPDLFFIGDTHFGHANILKFEPVLRPFAAIGEHDACLIARWNATVKPNDFVWHLGDVVFGDKVPALERIMPRLNGHKGLILGNHDSPAQAQVYLKYFEKLGGTLFLPIDNGRKLVLSHAPVHPCQLEFRAVANVHGHMHSKKVNDPRYINVSVEHTKLTPLAYDDLIKLVPA